jgi:hypothetical protein
VRLMRLWVVVGSIIGVSFAVMPSAALAGHVRDASTRHHGGGGSGDGNGDGSGGGSSGGSSTVGYDISYPQCGASYPSHPVFGIVGVNGGLANDPNSCFGSELQWALASPGQATPQQPSASLYMNTANPGPRPGVTDWPSSGTSPYGSCDGSWSQSCSYVYGEQRAAYSYGLVNSANSGVAASAPWWLDIETANSWATSSTQAYTQLNIATIQGFVAGLQGSGANGPVGIYSTAYQWNQITGLAAQTTASGFGSTPPSWVAGASSLSGAQTNCSSTGFTGVRPTLAQYPSNGFDADYRCT